MSKYNPLSKRLQGHPGDEWRASFSEIEEVLGFPLPKTARTGKAWWSADAEKPHSRAWAGQGWQADVDHAGEAVTFRRSAISPVAMSAAAGLEPVGELTEMDLDMPEPPPPPYVDPALIPAKTEARPKPKGISPPPAALIAAGAALVVGIGALAMRTFIRKR